MHCMSKIRTLQKGVVVKNFNVTCPVSLHSVHDQATAAANDHTLSQTMFSSGCAKYEIGQQYLAEGVGVAKQTA